MCRYFRSSQGLSYVHGRFQIFHYKLSVDKKCNNRCVLQLFPNNFITVFWKELVYLVLMKQSYVKLVAMVFVERMRSQIFSCLSLDICFPQLVQI